MDIKTINVTLSPCSNGYLKTQSYFVLNEILIELLEIKIMMCKTKTRVKIGQEAEKVLTETIQDEPQKDKFK